MHDNPCLTMSWDWPIFLMSFQFKCPRCFETVCDPCYKRHIVAPTGDTIVVCDMCFNEVGMSGTDGDQSGLQPDVTWFDKRGVTQLILLYISYDHHVVILNSFGQKERKNETNEERKKERKTKKERKKKEWKKEEWRKKKEVKVGR